ncbi:hypothetical protein DPMN_114486 [Dreissena polymorpha]|uniref:Uncharacterized protein n=1 Tax=Dreissena polymorpha TaxID=45954 RepID=A0A9D4KJY9_DREPO|nr:hypothetical protein DPMN_114486 [Dreissena polymorpha]
MDTADRSNPHGSRSGTIQDDPWTFFEFVSVDDVPKTITPGTTRDPHGLTHTNTDSLGSNTQSTRRQTRLFVQNGRDTNSADKQ